METPDYDTDDTPAPLRARLLVFLPELEELVFAYEPSWDYLEVVETEDEHQQRMDYGVIKTAYELINEAIAALDNDAQKAYNGNVTEK